MTPSGAVIGAAGDGAVAPVEARHTHARAVLALAVLRASVVREIANDAPNAWDIKLCVSQKLVPALGGAELIIQNYYLVLMWKPQPMSYLKLPPESLS